MNNDLREFRKKKKPQLAETLSRITTVGTS